MSGEFNQLASKWPVDIKGRHRYLLAGIGGVPEDAVDVIKNDSGQDFSYTNVKVMNPYSGSLPIHCGRQFKDLFSEYVLLDKVKNPENQLSYFTVLQYPWKGGDIQLYNLRYSDTPQFEDATQTRAYVRRAKGQQLLKPEPGTLFLFNGGEIWHRTTKIRGEKPRISLSAFTSRARNSENIILWTWSC